MTVTPGGGQASWYSPVGVRPHSRLIQPHPAVVAPSRKGCQEEPVSPGDPICSTGVVNEPSARGSTFVLMKYPVQLCLLVRIAVQADRPVTVPAGEK